MSNGHGRPPYSPALTSEQLMRILDPNYAGGPPTDWSSIVDPSHAVPASTSQQLNVRNTPWYTPRQPMDVQSLLTPQGQSPGHGPQVDAGINSLLGVGPGPRYQPPAAAPPPGPAMRAGQDPMMTPMEDPTPPPELPQEGLLDVRRQARQGRKVSKREAWGDALMSAGLRMMQVSGGPRQWGTFGPTAMASIAAGIESGREAYETSKGRQKREILQEEMINFDMDADGSREQMADIWRRAVGAGQMDIAQQAQTMIASGAMRQRPVTWQDMGTEYWVKDPESGMPLRDDQGNPITFPKKMDRNQTMTQHRLETSRIGTELYRARNNYEDGPGKIKDNYHKLAEPLALWPPDGNLGTLSGIDRVSYLYAFIKAIDPDSVVRMGEVRLVEEAQTMQDRIKSMVAQFGLDSNEISQYTNRFLSDDVMGQLHSVITRMADMQVEKYEADRDTLWNMYKDLGLPSDGLQAAIGSPNLMTVDQLRSSWKMPETGAGAGASRVRAALPGRS